jgi:uncharacterized protein
MPGLNTDEKRELLRIARETLVRFFTQKQRVLIPPERNALQEVGGAFVTLTKNGQLCGCIGMPDSPYPLYEVVCKCVVSAAVEDHRFRPIAMDELPLIDIEISALSPSREIKSVSEIIVGEHGLIISRGYQRGLLLPQVAVKYRWDLTTFLQETCRKAGLPSDAWEKDTQIKIFTAEVFSERDYLSA